MSDLDDFVQEIIQAEQDKIAAKIYNEVLVPFFIEQRQEEERRNRGPILIPESPDDGRIYMNNSTSAGGSECAGTYPVSGYTREDGTEVSGYMRTCGAAHAGSSQESPKQSEGMPEGENDWKNVKLDDIDELLYKDAAEELEKRQNSLVLEGRVKKDEVLDKNQNNILNHEVLKDKNINEYIEKLNLKNNKDSELSVVENLQKKLAQKIPLHEEFPLKDYYKIALDLADNVNNVKTDDVNIVYKLKDLPASVNKSVVINKIVKGLNLDLNNKSDLRRAENTVVVVPRANSKLVEILKQSDVIKSIIKNEYNNIVQDKYRDKYYEAGARFEKPSGREMLRLSSNEWDRAHLFGTIHNADVYDITYSNKEGISLVISDFYDFDYWESKPDNDIVDKGTIFVNNNAYKQQQLGHLKPYVLYIPIKFTPEEVRDILYE